MGADEKENVADMPDGMSVHDGVSASLDRKFQVIGSDVWTDHFAGFFRVRRRARKPIRNSSRLEITSYPATRHFWGYWHRSFCWNFKRLE